MTNNKQYVLTNLKDIRIPILIGILLTIQFYSLSIFVSGIEFLLLPIFSFVFLAGVLGIVTIPIGVYRFYKRIKIKRYLYWLVGLALGFYLELLIQKPIDSWDNTQRNLTGKYLAKQIKNYYLLNGYYPDSLNL